MIFTWNPISSIRSTSSKIIIWHCWRFNFFWLRKSFVRQVLVLVLKLNSEENARGNGQTSVLLRTSIYTSWASSNFPPQFFLTKKNLKELLTTLMHFNIFHQILRYFCCVLPGTSEVQKSARSPLGKRLLTFDASSWSHSTIGRLDANVFPIPVPLEYTNT